MLLRKKEMSTVFQNHPWSFPEDGEHLGVAFPNCYEHLKFNWLLGLPCLNRGLKIWLPFFLTLLRSLWKQERMAPVPNPSLTKTKKHLSTHLSDIFPTPVLIAVTYSFYGMDKCHQADDVHKQHRVTAHGHSLQKQELDSIIEQNLKL